MMKMMKMMSGETRSFPHRRAMIFYILTFLICGSVCLSGGKASCHAKENPDGSVTYHRTDSVPDTKTYSWVINETVIAHEEDYDRQHVLDRGPQNITTKECWESMAFKDTNTLVLTPCPYNCPRKQSGNVSALSDQYRLPPAISSSASPPTPSTASFDVGRTESGPSLGAIVCISVGIIAVALLIGLVVWKRDKLKGACKPQQTSYSSASQTQDEESL